MVKLKLVRNTTVANSLHKLLDGQLKFMSGFYDVVAVSSSGELLEKVKVKEGVRIKVIEMTREITFSKDLKALWEMYQFLCKEKPFIVHTHTPKAGIVGMMAAWFARVPVRLHTVAGLPLTEARGIKRKLLNFVERLTYKFATKVYPNSHGLKDYIIFEKFCNPKKLKVIGSGSSNGIDTTYFDPIHYSNETRKRLRESFQIDESDFVFIFIGRLVKDKGINELVAAFNELIFYKCKLMLVGSFEKNLDPLFPETDRLIIENPNIISIGYQDDVRSYLSISDCLVFPSYREGFPNVVMQAGAMGLPSIVTNINGCNEIIIEGENGIIIPSKDKEALLDAMQFFFLNPKVVKQMAENARQLIVTRYEQKAVWEALLAEYKSFEEENEK